MRSPGVATSVALRLPQQRAAAPPVGGPLSSAQGNASDRRTYIVTKTEILSSIGHILIPWPHSPLLLSPLPPTPPPLRGPLLLPPANKPTETPAAEVSAVESAKVVAAWSSSNFYPWE
mmetsp:Transcript_36252/g.86023  ORF Transcript_36252/g.86023 Transcript_36252/m.86023 type:complete len:118 (-) Transcript_36252:286-639(-)